MTKEQPYVLRLADVLDGFPLLPITEAADELRRLHSENEQLKAERDEVLTSLKDLKGDLYWILEGGEFATWVSDVTMPLAAAKELRDLEETVKSVATVLAKATGK